ncbi:WD40 repeat-like protein [Sistotremastrum niveocremeum HHB9708]|uniref:non-specific serine/threonine protein kinase n=1 Tax=Sistotremastrum niveocremeum HHB9708 TaxID=1314777 RepID=A0A164YI36_9AGAM|nr:WD40 repeat-like protein [Sistotremastrum niveocremeum HHB9708]
MGNSASVGPIATGALDSYVSELGDELVYEKSLGSTRFLKSVKVRHRNGPLVIKFFIKPDPDLSLRNYHKKLKSEREALADIPNVHNYQVFFENEKAGYMIRQWVASSLYDRISTRPFLALIEKKWIAFQILHALRDARNRRISHGDVKSSNILVTSWNWVYLTDFASYKPTYLPLKDPADFSFYFDTSGRRTCYVAPERFYDAENEPPKRRVAGDDIPFGRREGKLLESMDVFSAGCVIAELWLDGDPIFSLSSMFKYRSGEMTLDGILSRIEDPDVQSLIRRMTSLEPAARPTFDSLLHLYRGSVFPETFYAFLHGYVSSMNMLSTPNPFSAMESQPSPDRIVMNGLQSNQKLPSDADHRLERIWAEYDGIEPNLLADSEASTVMQRHLEADDHLALSDEAKHLYKDIFPVVLHLANRESQSSSSIVSAPPNRLPDDDSPALILLSLILANIRNASLPSSKLKALDVMLALSAHLTDESKLDRILPYLVDLTRDDSAVVRAAAMRTLMQLSMRIVAVTPANASIFIEYIIPNVRSLSSDPDVLVRSMFAQCISYLADTAATFVEKGQALRAHGTFAITDGSDLDKHYEASYDTNLSDLHGFIQELLGVALADPSSSVKRAVLQNVSSLCVFLGREKTNDLLLSHMITYLNDRDWLLRYAFFDAIGDVAIRVAGRSVEEYILPLMYQALSDAEESVISKVLATLTSSAELGLFARIRVWELMSASLGFLYHPNIWIRQGAVAFIAAATKTLPKTDIWAILYPSLKHYLLADVDQIVEPELLSFLKPPLPRQIFDEALSWAMKNDKSQFWRLGSPKPRPNDSAKENMASARKAGPASVRQPVPKSEEDEAQLARLRLFGMNNADEAKLLTLREYLLKHATSIASSSSRVKIEAETEALCRTDGIELQKLGVILRTIFLGSRGTENNQIRSQAESARMISESIGSRRTSLTSSPRPQTHADRNGSLVVDDLRRQLVMNSSTASLTQGAHSKERRGSVSSTSGVSVSIPLPPSAIPGTAQDIPLSSPSGSLPSNTPFSTLRGKSRLPMGLSEPHKAAAAVASSKTNAVGTMEPTAQLRAGTPHAPSSGRTSPVSNVGTLRGPESAMLPLQSRFGLQTPGTEGLLEQIYHDYERSRDASNEFGPPVHEGPVRRRNALRQPFSQRSRGDSPAEAQLIAHLASHGGPVNGIAVAPDHSFFVSCSDDKTVKVWDTARLERNVTSKARHTYSQHHSKVTAICILEGLHCFASAGEDGSVHVVRVHLSQSSSVPKYGKLQIVREHRLWHAGDYATCMVHYKEETTSNLVYGSNQGIATVLDLKTGRTLFTLSSPRHSGPIVSLCLDPKRIWLVTITISGMLSLWDLRFGLLLKKWKVGHRGSRVSHCCLHPSKGKGQWVIVAVDGCNETCGTGAPGVTLLEVWDIETSSLVESYSTSLHQEGKGDERAERPPPADCQARNSDKDTAAQAIAELVRSRTTTRAVDEGAGVATLASPFLDHHNSESTESQAVSSLVAGLDLGGQPPPGSQEPFGPLNIDGDRIETTRRTQGFLLTGSRDTKLRLWDLERVEYSSVLCGADVENHQPSYSTSSSEEGKPQAHLETWPPSNTRRLLSRTNLIAGHQQALLRAHQDSITAVACVDSPFRKGIITGDRAGVLKVWRVEYP